MIKPHLWSLVTTLKTTPKNAQNFAAHHLDIGATHLFIFIDDCDPSVINALSSHPKITVLATDAPYWAKVGNRPDTVEMRQVANAEFALRLCRSMHPDIEWMGHIDVDEFICVPPDVNFGRRLARLPVDTLIATIAPIEYLVPATPDDMGPDHFKRLATPWERRRKISRRIFPEFGDFILGGFISHQIGKSLFRINNSIIYPKIHFPKYEGIETPPNITMAGIELAHYHTQPWEQFIETYQSRRLTGSYRNGLSDHKTFATNRRTIQSIMDELERTDGINGIKRLFYELCVARPELIAALDQFNLLRIYDMQFDAKRAKHFPNFAISG